MIYLLDEGNEYEFCLNCVVEGDGDIKAMIKEYRAQQDAHIKDYRRLEAQILKKMDKRPKIPVNNNKQDFAQWQFKSQQWQKTFNHRMEQSGCAPYLPVAEIAKKYGFKVLQYEIVSIDSY